MAEIKDESGEAIKDESGESIFDESGPVYYETITDGIKASDAALTAFLTQHSFRFREDDDSEAAATWKAALNTAINLGAGNTFRLRYLINALNDPASKQYQIEYRRKPSGGAFGPWKQIN